MAFKGVAYDFYTRKRETFRSFFFSLLLLILAIIGLVVLGDVEGLVNCLRDGLDVRIHLLLNALHVVPIVICDQVDGETKVA